MKRTKFIDILHEPLGKIGSAEIKRTMFGSKHIGIAPIIRPKKKTICKLTSRTLIAGLWLDAVTALGKEMTYIYRCEESNLHVPGMFRSFTYM